SCAKRRTRARECWRSGASRTPRRCWRSRRTSSTRRWRWPRSIGCPTARRAYEEARAALEREASAAREREAAARAAKQAEAQSQADQTAIEARGTLATLLAEAEALVSQELAAARAAFQGLETRWREAAKTVEAGELGSRFDEIAASLRARADAA